MFNKATHLAYAPLPTRQAYYTYPDRNANGKLDNSNIPKSKFTNYNVFLKYYSTSLDNGSYILFIFMLFPSTYQFKLLS